MARIFIFNKKHVSHRKLRSEKICLNCGTETTGRYCPACGQENIEPKQSVWHLVTHFFSDITHFDGKFFVTVKDLFAKPGFLSREYMLGRRASYLDPIRMYIFTSATFFLIFFSFSELKTLDLSIGTREEIQKNPELRQLANQAKSLQDSLRLLHEYNAKKNPIVNVTVDSTKDKRGIVINVDNDFRSVEAYDSSQRALPPAKRDGWMKRNYRAKEIEISVRMKKDTNNFLRELWNNFMHEFPKILFVSLPLFALILKLLYVRRRQFYYVDHGIFAIHLYIFSFLTLLVYFGLIGLQSYAKGHWFSWVVTPMIFLVSFYPFFYYYKAMRRFYGQGRGKTLVKYFLLFVLSFIVQLFIFIGFALFTLIET